MSAVPVETLQEAARRILGRFLSDGYEPVALHEYRDAEGNPVFWRARCKHPDGRKAIRPFHWSGAAYVASEPPAPAEGKLLYRLPTLLAATPDAIAYVVEGEGCVDRLVRLGVLATTSGSSASASASAGGADWTPLRGRRVRLWPDNDEAGAKYADAVAERLRALDCAVEVIDVDTLDLPPKGDCVDWLAAHPEADAVAVNALPLVQAGQDAVREEVSHMPRVELVRGDTLTPEAVDWLWDGWLPAGKLAILGGQPGTGKTTIAMALAATLTIGGRWPDGTRAEPGAVVIWSGEDDPADTLVPRLRAMGADMARVYFVQGVREDGERRAFDPATDSDALLTRLDAIGDVRLLVIDPIVSAVAGDSHKNAEVRRGLQPLVDLAQRHRCALLGITHFTKGTAGREPVERITGSLAFGALARLVMVTARAEEKDGEASKRFLARAKSNIGPDGGGYVYDLQQGALRDFPGVEASSVLWGVALEGSARELLADAEQQEAPASPSRNAATEWLRSILTQSHGALESTTIKDEGNAAGYSWATLRRAKDDIGVTARKNGRDGGWRWELPAGAFTAEDAQGAQDAQAFGVSIFGEGCAPSGVAPAEDAQGAHEGAQQNSLSTLSTLQGAQVSTLSTFGAGGSDQGVGDGMETWVL
ncbi:MAG: AAA family ATPase [Pseudomonas sp.]